MGNRTRQKHINSGIPAKQQHIWNNCGMALEEVPPSDSVIAKTRMEKNGLSKIAS
jgi:hypothetical protein